MHVEVVEVVARIASSVVAVAHVTAGERYRIGTAPGVELAVAAGALRSFPLLDEGFVFRRPAGIAATLHTEGGDAPIEDVELRLQPGWRVELALGQVVVSLARIQRARVAVPRPPADLRPLAYGGAVLAAHLLVWAAAMLVEPIERLAVEIDPAPRPPLVRVAHIEEPPPPPPPPPKPAAAASRAGGPATPATERSPGSRGARGPRDPEARAIASARDGGMLGALGDLSVLIPKVDVRKLVNESVFYDEEAANRGNFGNARRFDPTRNCTDCGIVEAGQYATVATGHGAGDDYDLPGAVRHPQPEIAMCEPGACHVSGATPRETVRKQLELRLGAFGYCYQRLAAKQLRGQMVVAFVIAPDGTVHDAKAKGLDEFGDCVVDVVNVIPFPPADEPTAVSYPLSFRPS